MASFHSLTTSSCCVCFGCCSYFWLERGFAPRHSPSSFWFEYSYPSKPAAVDRKQNHAWAAADESFQSLQQSLGQARAEWRFETCAQVSSLASRSWSCCSSLNLCLSAAVDPYEAESVQQTLPDAVMWQTLSSDYALLSCAGLFLLSSRRCLATKWLRTAQLACWLKSL